MLGRPKYRLRTRLREWLPYNLHLLVPKGPGDCGQHDSYNHDGVFECCYHCKSGIRAVRPEWEPLDGVGRPKAEDFEIWRRPIFFV